MTMIQTKGARKHTHGMAVALGILVLVAFAIILMVASPWEGFLETNIGGSGGSTMGDLFNMNSVQCAMQQYCR